MPGIIFTRYDQSRVPADRPDQDRSVAGRPGSLDRRRFIGGISALAATASVGFMRGQEVLAQGTPAVADASGPVAALRALLQRLPASLTADNAQAMQVYHADLAAQFAACGVDRSASDWRTTTNLYSVTASLALVSAGFQYGASDDFAQSFGFQPLDVDRALEVGSPPNALSVYQGGFERTALEATWTQTGFKQVSLDGGLVLWTMGEEGEIDPSSPIVQFGAGAFNNLLLLDDHTLLVARMGKVIRTVAAFASSADESASMLGIAGIQEATAALSPTVVSSIGLDGTLLTASSRPGAAATPVASGAMPAISVAVFGIEAGARGQIDATGATPAAATAVDVEGASAKVEVRLVTGSKADAEEAAKVAASRWETMQSQVTQQPYSQLMTLSSAGVSEAEEVVAAIDFESGPMPGRWIQLVAMQDLAPFAPGGN
ncbi:MAG: hypothetical protein QM589_02115 [Thermomicrobiales bacterium]